MGFDNAHAVTPKGSRFRKPMPEHDHWHRDTEDEGRPYKFTTVEQLLLDFEAESTRVLHEHGVATTVTSDSDTSGRRSS
jgi:hypothetical protein